VRARGWHVAEAISAYLVRVGPLVEPRALAWVVGTAAGATGCALTVAGERYQWGDGTAWLDHAVTYAGEPQGVLYVTPEPAGPLTSVVAPPVR